MELTGQLAHARQLDLDPLVAVLEAKALHVRPIVVPHHSHLQLGGHLQGHRCTLFLESCPVQESHLQQSAQSIASR